MGSSFSFHVDVETERVTGKFASREELEEQILEAIEQADPGSLSGADGGEYEVVSWEVEAEESKTRRRKSKKTEPGVAARLELLFTAYQQSRPVFPTELQAKHQNELRALWTDEDMELEVAIRYLLSSSEVLELIQSRRIEEAKKKLSSPGRR